MAKDRTINLADEQKVILKSYGAVVVEIDFSIPEQVCTVSFRGRGGAVVNPVTVSVDTKMLGHSEDDD